MTRDWLIYIDTYVIFILTLDLTLRFVFCPRKIQFMFSAYTIIDILSLLPPIFVLLHQCIEGHVITSLTLRRWDDNISRIISLLKVFVVLRLFRITRHYSGFKVSNVGQLICVFFLILIELCFLNSYCPSTSSLVESAFKIY